jgi:hypothetical protein
VVVYQSHHVCSHLASMKYSTIGPPHVQSFHFTLEYSSKALIIDLNPCTIELFMEIYVINANLVSGKYQSNQKGDSRAVHLSYISKMGGISCMKFPIVLVRSILFIVAGSGALELLVGETSIVARFARVPFFLSVFFSSFFLSFLDPGPPFPHFLYSNVSTTSKK